MSKKIPLTQGKFAIVDDKNYDYLSQFSWYAVCLNPKRDTWYAKCCMRTKSGQERWVLLHRFIMQPKKGEQIDHVNHNGLDCREINMRTCNQSQNNANARPHLDSSSQYKGVSWCKRDRTWCVKVTKNHKSMRISTFHNEHEAAKAYNQIATELYGEFAYLNKIVEGR